MTTDKCEGCPHKAHQGRCWERLDRPGLLLCECKTRQRPPAVAILQRRWPHIDDDMDAEKDRSDGGLVDGGRYERQLETDERTYERRTGIPNFGR